MDAPPGKAAKDILHALSYAPVSSSAHEAGGSYNSGSSSGGLSGGGGGDLRYSCSSLSSFNSRSSSGTASDDPTLGGFF